MLFASCRNIYLYIHGISSGMKAQHWIHPTIYVSLWNPSTTQLLIIVCMFRTFENKIGSSFERILPIPSPASAGGCLSQMPCKCQIDDDGSPLCHSTSRNKIAQKGKKYYWNGGSEADNKKGDLETLSNWIITESIPQGVFTFYVQQMLRQWQQQPSPRVRKTPATKKKNSSKL